LSGLVSPAIRASPSRKQASRSRLATRSDGRAAAVAAARSGPVALLHSVEGRSRDAACSFPCDWALAGISRQTDDALPLSPDGSSEPRPRCECCLPCKATVGAGRAAPGARAAPAAACCPREQWAAGRAARRDCRFHGGAAASTCTSASPERACASCCQGTLACRGRSRSGPPASGSRRRGRTVGELGHTEPLRPLPPSALPPEIVIECVASWSALVAVEGNRWVPPCTPAAARSFAPE